MSEWTDIGEQLRKARESKDLDLRDIAHSTRIPLATLAALEESDYSIFPSPTYARSFLAQYSEFLGVDAHEWVDAFETGDVLCNINDHGYLQSHNEHIGAPRHTPKPRRNSGRTSQNPDEPAAAHSSGGTSILQTLTVFLITTLLIGGGIYAYKKYEPMLKGALAEDHADSQDSSPVGTSDADAGASPETATTPSPQPANADPSPVATTDPAKTPEKPENAAPEKPKIGKPPKALVIDEDEE